jgi:hypothetical protein
VNWRGIGLQRWALLVGASVVLLGYWGPWVDHAAAGLVIIGLDLGEYVKFLPEVRSGVIALWREGFYLPLFTVSLALSFHAFRRELAYHWFIQGGMVGVAMIIGLNMLPPAWSPLVLQTPEFCLQTVAIGVCLTAALFSPFLALLPRLPIAIICALLAGAAIWLPVSGFLAVLDAIAGLYGHTLTPGWGMFVMALGLVILGGSALIGAFPVAQSESGAE